MTTIPIQQTDTQRQAALAAAGVSAASLPQTAVDVSKIGATPAIALPPLPTAQLPNYANVAVTTPITQTTPVTPDTTPTLPVIQDTPEEAQLKADQNSIVSGIQADNTKLGTKATRKSQLESDAGLHALNQQSNELNDLIRKTQADALNAYNTSEDRQAPTFAITGEQASIERIRAAKIFGYAAAAEAVNGKIALAQDHIDSALTAEFDPITKEIENKKFLLQINMDNFSTAEKRRAEAQSILLDQQKQAAQDAKDAKAKVYDVMLTAAQNGADNATLTKIQNAKTPDEAITLAGSVLGQKFLDDKAQQKFDNNIKLATLAIEERKARNDAAAATADPSQILAYAQQYASNGNIPTGLPKGTFGIVSQVAKELPKPDGAIVDFSTGVTSSNVSSTQRDGATALRDLTKKLDQLQTTYSTTGILSKSADRAKYNDLRNEVVDLIARARTGATINDDEAAKYEAKLPALLSVGSLLHPTTIKRPSTGVQNIADLKSSLSGKLDTLLSNNNAVMYGYTKVNIGGQPYTVGQLITNPSGQTGRVNADGTVTLVQ
jgi:hypothetical protein